MVVGSRCNDHFTETTAIWEADKKNKTQQKAIVDKQFQTQGQNPVRKTIFTKTIQQHPE